MAMMCASAVAFLIDHKPASAVTGQITVTPARTEMNVDAGQTVRMDVMVVDNLGKPVSITMGMKDGQPSGSPDSFIEVVDQARFGAGNWCHLERPRFDLQHGDHARQTITCDVPIDADPGSHYAIVTVNGGSSKAGAGGQIAAIAKATIGYELFLNVSGEVTYGGKIHAVRGPRIMQRSSGTYLPAEAIFENTGSVTNLVQGSVRFRSIFGNTAHVTMVPTVSVLRSGSRRIRVVWNDPPWIGRFNPTFVLTDRKGHTYTVSTGATWIFPPWYYDLSLLSAIIAPALWYLRRRNDWRKYLDDEDFDFEDEGDSGEDYET